MRNFIKIIPKQGFEDWPLKLTRMSRLLWETEYSMLKIGLRIMADVNIDQDNLIAFEERFNRDGFIFTPLKMGPRLSGYHYDFESPVVPREAISWYGIITKDQSKAEEFKKYFLNQDHVAIGQMFGYPVCCVKYYNEEFQKNWDPVWVNEKGSIKGFVECNSLLRYFGPRIVGHLSCSPECEETRKLGQIWLKIMKKIDKNLTLELINLLKGKINWNSYHGVVQVDTPFFLSVANTFPYLKKPKIINWQSI